MNVSSDATAVKTNSAWRHLSKRHKALTEINRILFQAERHEVFVKNQREEFAQVAHDWVTRLSGKWTIRVLVAMESGPIRLGDLRRAIPGASKKILIDTLKRLERTGLIKRIDLSASIKHVEYCVTENRREQLYRAIASLSSLESLKRDTND